MNLTNPSGTFQIGGDLAVKRLGFGAMQITGQGVWGEPANHAEAIQVLKPLPRDRHQFYRHRRFIWP